MAWEEMKHQHKRKRVSDWAFQKFTLDPKGLCMLPVSKRFRKPRNEISWLGFEMTDEETAAVV